VLGHNKPEQGQGRGKLVRGQELGRGKQELGHGKAKHEQVLGHDKLKQGQGRGKLACGQELGRGKQELGHGKAKNEEVLGHDKLKQGQGRGKLARGQELGRGKKELRRGKQKLGQEHEQCARCAQSERRHDRRGRRCDREHEHSCWRRREQARARQQDTSARCKPGAPLTVEQRAGCARWRGGRRLACGCKWLRPGRCPA
jgi:hypothetical protein